MYHCYLRGKQNELLAVRESISKIVEANMTIIVEPVKQNDRDLLACVKCIKENNANFILIINPCVAEGELTGNEAAMDGIMERVLEEYPDIMLGLIVNQMTSLSQLNYFLKKYPQNNFTLIHTGELPINLKDINVNDIAKNIFLDQAVSQSYINAFGDIPKVVIKDNFNKQPKNANYRLNLQELFLNLQETMSVCKTYNYIGFGDFSIIGDNYSTTGSQPVTVAIHLTYDGYVNGQTNIYIQHFLSEDRVSREQVSLLIDEAFEDILSFVKQRQDILQWSSVCQAIVKKAQGSDSTSLGYLKKLSIKHHFELMHHLHQKNYFVSS